MTVMMKIQWARTSQHKVIIHSGSGQLASNIKKSDSQAYHTELGDYSLLQLKNIPNFVKKQLQELQGCLECRTSLCNIYRQHQAGRELEQQVPTENSTAGKKIVSLKSFLDMQSGMTTSPLSATQPQ